MSTPVFKDHFSGVAADYARYRPLYPPALYEAIARAAPGRHRVWDVACGNGQASVDLATHFAEVLATDASTEQVARAHPNPKVRYAVAPAEASNLPSHSCDAVTIAQALHWFNHERFYAEVRRVAVPKALVVAWAYARSTVAADVNPIFDDYYDQIVGPYWPPERRDIESGYRDLPWPFAPVDLGTYELTAQWSLDDFIGYLGTWSSTARYRKAVGSDPLPALRARLAAVWGDGARTVRWPLTVLAGRVS